jgi:predicted secreted protein
MKKFLAIALIAASFAACNEGENTTENTVSDTTTVVEPATMDTMQVVTDSTTTVTVDTLNK